MPLVTSRTRANYPHPTPPGSPDSLSRSARLTSEICLSCLRLPQKFCCNCQFPAVGQLLRFLHLGWIDQALSNREQTPCFPSNKLSPSGLFPSWLTLNLKQRLYGTGCTHQWQIIWKSPPGTPPAIFTPILPLPTEHAHSASCSFTARPK